MSSNSMSGLEAFLLGGTAGALQSVEARVAEDREFERKMSLEELRFQRQKELQEIRHQNNIDYQYLQHDLVLERQDREFLLYADKLDMSKASQREIRAEERKERLASVQEVLGEDHPYYDEYMIWAATGQMPKMAGAGSASGLKTPPTGVVNAAEERTTKEKNLFSDRLLQSVALTTATGLENEGNTKAAAAIKAAVKNLMFDSPGTKDGPSATSRRESLLSELREAGLGAEVDDLVDFLDDLERDRNAEIARFAGSIMDPTKPMPTTTARNIFNAWEFYQREPDPEARAQFLIDQNLWNGFQTSPTDSMIGERREAAAEAPSPESGLLTFGSPDRGQTYEIDPSGYDSDQAAMDAFIAGENEPVNVRPYEEGDPTELTFESPGLLAAEQPAPVPEEAAPAAEQEASRPPVPEVGTKEAYQFASNLATYVISAMEREGKDPLAVKGAHARERERRVNRIVDELIKRGDIDAKDRVVYTDLVLQALGTYINQNETQ